MNDGFLNILSAGDHKDVASGIIIVVDLLAVESMAANWDQATKAGMPDLRIGFEGPGTEAAAWVIELLPRVDGLFAKIKWTPEGSQAVSDKVFQWIDVKVGELAALGQGRYRPEVLSALTLSNRPSLESLPQLPPRLAPAPPPADTGLIADRLGLVKTARLSSVLAEITRIQNRAAATESEHSILANRATTAERELIGIRIRLPNLETASSLETTLRNRISSLETQLTAAQTELATVKKSVSDAAQRYYADHRKR